MTDQQAALAVLTGALVLGWFLMGLAFAIASAKQRRRRKPAAPPQRSSSLARMRERHEAAERERLYREYRDQVAADLLDQISNESPRR